MLLERSMSRAENYQMLAMDGGGVKGIIPARVLVYLEKQTGTPISTLFPSVAGTSIGSLLACGITIPNDEGTVKYTARQIFTLFQDNMSKVFESTLWKQVSTLGGLAGVKYSTEGLEKLLVETLGDTSLSSSLCHLTIPSTGLNHETAYLFCSNIQRDVMMRQAVRASTAAPTFFESYTLNLGGENLEFADGGVWANNPTMCSYIEELKQKPSCRSKNHVVVSIGTGDVKTSLPSSSKNWGVIHWLENITGLMMDANASATDTQMRFLMSGTAMEPTSRTYCRIDPAISLDHVALDDTSPENIKYLVDKTEEYLDNNELILENLCRLIMPQENK